jgi:hypothetical protein
MSKAYDLFIQEFTSTGRERMEGISYYNLKNLDEHERPEVLQMLMSAFKQKDERIPIALAFVEPVDAIRTLLTDEINSASRAEPFDLFAVNCAAALVSFVNDDQALDYLEQVAQESKDLWTRSTAEQGLQRSTDACNASERLGRMILKAPAGNTAVTLAGTLLERHGWLIEDPNTQEETITLLNVLTEGSSEQRREGISKVLKAPFMKWPRKLGV